MPRGARIGFSAQIYHVITRGNNRQWVFQKDEDFCRYLEIVGRYKERGGFKLYHWVLMNNHQFSSGASYREFVCTIRDVEDQKISTRSSGGVVGTDDFREQVRGMSMALARHLRSQPPNKGIRQELRGVIYPFPSNSAVM